MAPASLFRRPGFWLAIVLLLAGVAFGLMRARGPKVRTVTVTRKDLEQHILASGRVRVSTRVQVSAQSPGLVQAVNVREGQQVKAGEVLIQIDDAEARAAVIEANAAVSQANARMNQLRRVGAVVANEGLRQAMTNLGHAESELDRTRKLASSGSVSPVALDDARRAADLSFSLKTTAEAQQNSSAPKGADTRVMLTSLIQAQAQLAAMTVGLSQTKILAQENSVVLTRTVEPGDVVQPSRTLLVLASNADAAQLVFQCDERNLAAIHVGQIARASADAYPDQVFDADVCYIAPSIDPERGSIEVRLLVRDAPKFLMPDMTVSVDLTVAAKKQVLTLPSEAVRSIASLRPWLFAIQRRRVIRLDVKLGIRGEGTVEIVSNLQEGAVVVLADAQLLTVGQHVRAVRAEL